MAKRIQAIVGSTSLAAAAIAGYVYAIRWSEVWFLFNFTKKYSSEEKKTAGNIVDKAGLKVEEKDEVPSKLKIPHMPEKEKEDAPSSKLQWGDVLDVVEADVNAKKVEENEQKLDDKEKVVKENDEVEEKGSKKEVELSLDKDNLPLVLIKE